jgi:hypothetical protein
MFHLRPGSSDLGLGASNAFDHFFNLAAYLNRTVTRRLKRKED